MLLNGKKLDMVVDTGAALLIISEVTRKSWTMFADKTLHPSCLVLRTYTDEWMEVMGMLNMQVQYVEQKKKLVLAVGCNGPSLPGRKWLKHIKLDWSSIVAVWTIKMKPLAKVFALLPILSIIAWRSSPGSTIMRRSHCIAALPPPSHTPPTLFEGLDNYEHWSSTGERYTADDETFTITYLGLQCLDWVLETKILVGLMTECCGAMS